MASSYTCDEAKKGIESDDERVKSFANNFKTPN